MFKWPTTPSVRAPIHELADFTELKCWNDRGTSATALSRLLGRQDENEYSDGVPEEEELDRRVEQAYMEIERRHEMCGDDYPFAIGEHGSTIRVIQDSRNPRHAIYKYLLLATRLNMRDDRIHAGIDGTLLFEELSADVAREYFGPRAKSLVFGTSAGSSGFEEKVNDLCHQLKEGGGFIGRDIEDTDAKDGKLDVVVWSPFKDGLPGKLIGFGQCKTGTYWEDSVTQIQPSAFRDKWLSSALFVPPVRMFFIAEDLASSPKRRGVAIDAGLLFDRCRIVDFCDGVDLDVMTKIQEWTEAAAKAVELPVMV